MIESTWKELTRLSEHLRTVPPGTDDYDKVLAEIKNLIQIQDLIAPDTREATESWVNRVLTNPALIGVIGNLVGIVWLTQHEKLNVITSRAFSFIRPK